MQKQVYEFISQQVSDPIIERRTCTVSGEEFPIFQSEQDFLDKHSPSFAGEQQMIPLPTLCREERQKQKMAHINQLYLFKRTCDATGKPIISNYLPDSPYKVYDLAYYRGDAWDAKDYGRGFDFSCPFFEQFHELDMTAPHPALFKDYMKDINSDYTNYAAMNKNSYLIFDSDENEEVLYSYGINKSKWSSDCYRCTKLENCYEMIDAHSCYASAYLQQAVDCRHCYFGLQLHNCDHCIMCANLANASYHYKNKPISKEAYEQLVAGFASYSGLEETKKEFADFTQQFARPGTLNYRTQQVVGNMVVDSKDAIIAFDSMNVEGGRYLTQIFIGAKEVYDVDEVGDCEIVYCSNNSGVSAYRLFFCYQCLNEVRDLYYCKDMFFSKNCFGCVGMKRAQYCIFNKQYTKEAYEKLVPKIIEHMMKGGERGQFFPLEHSPHPYNLTMAHEHHPLSKQSAKTQGSSWYDTIYGIDIPEGSKLIAAENMSDTLLSFAEVADKVFLCTTSQRPFRVTHIEHTLYERLGLPLPRKHFLTRHEERVAKRPGRELYVRICDNPASSDGARTGKDILSVYPESIPFEVYDEVVWQQEMYG